MPLPPSASHPTLRRFEIKLLTHSGWDICDFLLLWFLQLNFREEALEVKVKLMQEVVRTIRSLKQDYLPPKVKPEGKSVLPPDWEAPGQTTRSLSYLTPTHLVIFSHIGRKMKVLGPLPFLFLGVLQCMWSARQMKPLPLFMSLQMSRPLSASAASMATHQITAALGTRLVDLSPLSFLPPFLPFLFLSLLPLPSLFPPPKASHSDQ